MSANASVSIHKNINGFTLIELVAGIVVFGIVLAMISTLVGPSVRQSFDPLWQVRATELSESLANEIMAKAFDESNSLSGGLERCGEGLLPPCTISSAFGPDAGETRSTFDDVDDFHNLVLNDAAIVGALGVGPTIDGRPLYAGFSARVVVMYDDDVNGVNDDDVDGNGVLDTGTYIGDTKLVNIVVTAPNNDQIITSVLRRNF